MRPRSRFLFLFVCLQIFISSEEGEDEDTCLSKEDNISSSTITIDATIIHTVEDYPPVFWTQPQDTFAAKNKPATLSCKAAHALHVYFCCNGRRANASLEIPDHETGRRSIECKLNVTRDEVAQCIGKEFKCECIASSRTNKTKSHPATVSLLPYLEKQFVSYPESQSIESGQRTELSCVPPYGDPLPRISWLRNGVKLVEDKNIYVSTAGNLLIKVANLSHQANYTCVAQNTVGIQFSDPASLTVFAIPKMDVTWYIGLYVACLIISSLMLFLVMLLRSEERAHSLSSVSCSDFYPEGFSGQDNNLSQQPDVTATREPHYDYPFSPNLPMSCSISEHQYDVPISPLVPQPSNISPTVRTSTLEACSNRPIYFESEGSVTYSCSSSDSTSNVVDESLGLTKLETEDVVKAFVDTRGAMLVLPDSGISMFVPEGAVPKPAMEELHLAVLNEDRFRPRLPEGITQLSAVVTCGPTSAFFNKPIILQFEHCAILHPLTWELTIWASNKLELENTSSAFWIEKNKPITWTRLLTLGNETLNTPLFIQLDHSEVFILTEELRAYVLSGKSCHNSIATKRLRLVPFARQGQSCVRVYAIEDTKAAMKAIVDRESQIRGYLLDTPRTLLFEDNGEPLQISLEEVHRKKGNHCQSTPVERKKVCFRDVWNCQGKTTHVTFALETAFGVSSRMSYKLKASQGGSGSRQIFKIAYDGVKQLISSGSVTSPLREETLVSRRDANSLTDSTTLRPLRFTRSLRRQLCQYLDPPNALGNDWRMLAQILQMDRYINYFATKMSPMEHILDLWEARHREPTAVADLLDHLRSMNRTDAVTILETQLGLWLRSCLVESRV